ncbi:hypothetical protein BD324DRAFT_594457 [Kockovaella imperatae]|uniref:Cytoplasmic tRNA 2-thiolation protein 2 n=1 Tax=Kockovaella imperatae TaxID=4999 RepID=A0A1Y1U9C5_9TREE|nr:hypothetical protein BD324DRAFT_594457 [Kockovaella imperatae]ORX34106.1 hypothetical protein BD324DRAFT_594457 [Kockovaella imperatae]
MSCGSPAQADEHGEPEQALMPKRRPIPSRGSRICQRCREARAMFIIRSALYCRSCFEQNMRQRLMRQLYPALRPDEARSKNPSKRDNVRPPIQRGNALIALSGGAGSMAMLDMMIASGFIGQGDGRRADLKKGEKEILWDHATVVHVDFSGVSDGIEDRTEWLQGVAAARGLKFIAVKAEDVFDVGLAARLGLQKASERPMPVLEVGIHDAGMSLKATTSSETPLQSLKRMLATLSPASRPAFLCNVLDAILEQVARGLPDVSHLLLGETSTRQAQRIISGTALGRGWSLPLELASSCKSEGYYQVRAMKDISIKEASMYCWVNRRAMQNHRKWTAGDLHSGSRGKGSTSLEGLTEDFIAGLSVTHPATVSTITRTGEKLMFAGGDDRDSICPLCRLPKEQDPLEWKSKTSLTSLRPALTSTEDEESARFDLAPHLCYGCLTTLTASASKKGAPQSAILPQWISDRIRREAMRSEISEFLLDDT